MAVFADTNPTIFYEFIENLLQILFENPIDSYCATFMNVLDLFLQRDSHHGYLIHLSRIKNHFPNILKNPYFLIFYVYSLGNESDISNKIKILKTISVHVDSLSAFAKRKIL